MSEETSGIFSAILEGSFGFWARELVGRAIAAECRSNRWMLQAKKHAVELTLRDYAVLTSQVGSIREGLTDLWQRHEDGVIDDDQMVRELELLVIRMEDNVREREAMAPLPDATYLSPAIIIGNSLPASEMAEIDELLGDV